MKLLAKADAVKRVQTSGSIAEAVIATSADAAKLAADLKMQVPCVVLVCVK